VWLERQHGVVAADDLPVAEMDAVELAHRDLPGLALHVWEPGDLH
jgi:hypothetical protein